MKAYVKATILILIACPVMAVTSHMADSDIVSYLDNFENNGNQTVRTGAIDSMTIDFGIAKFHLVAGEITLFDFGWDEPTAMIFRGEMSFIIFPEDDIEKYQLKRFTGKEVFEKKIDSLCIFFNDADIFSLDFDFRKAPLPEGEILKQLNSAQDHAFSNMGIYLPNKLLCRFINENATRYVYADFYIKNMGRFAFREDHCHPDTYGLYELIMLNGRETYDIICCCPADDPWLLSDRAVAPIDVTDYTITSYVDIDGKMSVKCRISYNSLLSDVRYLYFGWYKKNRVISALDSGGDTLLAIEKKEPFKLMVNQHMESGFGLVLNEPLIAGESDYIDIEYECNCLLNDRGFFYISGSTTWYPMNFIRDPAVFTSTFYHPEFYSLVSGGNNAGRFLSPPHGVKSIWHQNHPVCNISFNIGRYYVVDLAFEDLPPVYIYTHIPVQTSHVGADLVNSMNYFTNLFGSCPFSIIRVADTPGGSIDSSPGMENISWNAFINNSTEGPQRMANQWWKHTLQWECYKDAWIVEGLSNYCSFMYFEKSRQRDLVDKGFVNDWCKKIIYGTGGGSKGTQAGPVILGGRLNSSKSRDYLSVAVLKSAYIFHMLRYMLHDYKTGSDSVFVGILRNLLSEYSDKPITTDKLQALLEQHLGDMSWFFNQWVYGIAIPEYHFSYDIGKTDADQYEVICHVKQKNVPDGFMMPVPVSVYFEDDRMITVRTMINKPEREVRLPLIPLKPQKVEFNSHNAVLCKLKK